MWIKTEDGVLINVDNIISKYCASSPRPNKICAKLLNGDCVAIRKFNTANVTYVAIDLIFDTIAQGCNALNCDGLKEE